MFAPGAGRFLVPSAAILAALWALWVVVPPHAGPAAALLLAASGVWAFLAIFFRDPERATGTGIVSAADGRIRAVEEIGGHWLISVFMGPTDVHVNRLPLDGTVATVTTAGSGYRPAFSPDAPKNVRRHYLWTTELGTIEVIQMTGIFARRLVSFVRAGDQKRKGDRFGMIVLGSRVDVLLPADRAEPLVRPGDRVRAGASSIARARP